MDRELESFRFPFFLIFGGARDGTQGLAHARQLLYPLIGELGSGIVTGLLWVSTPITGVLSPNLCLIGRDPDPEQTQRD
jgi:hypothetical protein